MSIILPIPPVLGCMGSFFLKNVVGLAQSSIWIYSIPLKHIVTAAHYNGKIPRNPFAMYHVDPDHKEREFLTLDELTAMTEIKLEDPNMAFARDLFIFGSWTGIAFIDIKNLTEDNISMVNGAPWIVSKRQKTGVPFQIKLMDYADREREQDSWSHEYHHNTDIRQGDKHKT